MIDFAAAVFFIGFTASVTQTGAAGISCFGKIGALVGSACLRCTFSDSEQIHLHFRLSAAGPNDDFVALLKIKFEHICRRQTANTLLVIEELLNLIPCDLGKWLASESGHDGRHGLGTSRALKCIRNGSVVMEPKLAIGILHCLVEVLAQRTVIACHLANKHRGNHSVFITCMSASKIAIAFFEPKNEAFFFAPLLHKVRATSF